MVDISEMVFDAVEAPKAAPKNAVVRYDGRNQLVKPSNLGEMVFDAEGTTAVAKTKKDGTPYLPLDEWLRKNTTMSEDEIKRAVAAKRFNKPNKGTNGRTKSKLEGQAVGRYRLVVQTYCEAQRICAHEWKRGVDYMGDDECLLCHAEARKLPIHDRIDGIYSVNARTKKMKPIPPHDGLIQHEGGHALPQPRTGTPLDPKTALALPNSYGYNVTRPSRG